MVSPMNVNNDSILETTKQLLGIGQVFTEFDREITVHINTVFSNLAQMGIGPETGFVITGPETLWSSFIGDTLLTQQFKSYVYLKVRIIFDPPANGNLLDALNKTASELEYRLYTHSGGY